MSDRRDVVHVAGTAPRLMPALSGSLLLSGIAPFIAYQALSRLGAPTVAVLAATSVFPVAGLAVGWMRARRIDGIGLLSLVVITIGLAASALSGNPRLYLLHGSFGSAAFGIVCLASLGVRRPLMFYLGRQLSSGDDRARQAAYDASWGSAGVRRRMRILTFAWGIGYLAEAGARFLIASTLPPSVTLVTSPLLGYAVPGLLLLWSLSYSGGDPGCGPNLHGDNHR